MEVLPPIMTVNFGPTCTCLLLPEGWLKTSRSENITDRGLSKPDTPGLSKLMQEVTRFSVRAFFKVVVVIIAQHNSVWCVMRTFNDSN